MSIEQKTNALPPAGGSVIENEIPAYRAISPGAVVSLVFGVLAVLSYASVGFLAFAAVAVVLGFLADRKIARMPDVLTGRSLAQAGVGLGLAFGLTSLTITTVQSFIRESEAKKFAKVYEEVLLKGSVQDVFFYGQKPALRKTTTAEKLYKDMTSKGGDPRMMDMQTTSIRDAKAAVGTPGAEAHFEKIERTEDDGNTLVAAALYAIHNDKAPPPAQKEQFALAILKGQKNGGKYEWWVEELRFPYTPASYVAAPKPVDDGHGHGEGDGH